MRPPDQKAACRAGLQLLSWYGVVRFFGAARDATDECDSRMMGIFKYSYMSYLKLNRAMIRTNESQEGLKTMREKYYEDYESYEHIPMADAERLFEHGQNRWYRVEKINWTSATENGKTDHAKVHLDVHKWTLEEIVDFARTTEEVWEDITSIEPWKE